MNGFKIDITGVINNMDFDKEKIKQYDGDFKKIATDLLRDNARISLEKVSLEQKNNNLQSKIDKANELLGEILVVSDWEHKGRFRPVKNTTAQDVYKTIVMLNELLETPRRINYELLKEDK